MTTIIGIDPGKTGAVSIWRDKKLHAVYDCPLVVEKGKKPTFDRHGMLGIVSREVRERNGHCHEVFAILEQQHAFAQQGGVGNFSAGQGYGLWQMALTACGVGSIECASQAWRKLIFSPDERDTIQLLDTLKERKAARKALSIQRAREACPQSAHLLARKKDDGRAEAILIGLAGFQMGVYQRAKL